MNRRSGFCRYENKYLVSEVVAGAMRSFVAAQLPPDPYAPAGELFGYDVHSVYLDSPWHELYRESAEGVKNRHKLRIRFYDALPASPAFLEIKSRVTATIHKQRAKVTKAGAMQLMSGLALSSSDILSNDDSSMRAIDEFCSRLIRIRGNPAALVSYKREAYVSLAAEAVRVTFDRNITGSPFSAGRELSPATNGVPIDIPGVVVEFKYVGSPPPWMNSMVRDFGLHRVSFPKYVHCLDAVRAKVPMGGHVSGAMQ